MKKRPTAFVSYAQSSRRWQELVLDFTVALRNPGGVDAEIDLFHDVDHQRWTTFGPNLIEGSDFTLIAVDQAYKRRWLGREKRGVGAGVGREAAAIRAIYERDQKEFLKRIKLVMLPGIGEEDVPADLLGDCERFPIESFTLDGLDRLLRSIYGRSAHPKPDLASIPSLPPKAVARLEGKNAPPDARSEHDPAAVKAANAVDARDEQNLRGQLQRVQVELKEVHEGFRKDTLLREQTALEVSLGALSQAPGALRRRARKRARGRAGGKSGKAVRRAVLGIALLAVAGSLIPAMKSLSSPRQTSFRPITARASGIRLQGPPGWRQQAGRAGISGLEIPAPVSLTAGSTWHGRAQGLAVVAGISHARGGKLLPTAYREQLGDNTRKASVDLGALEAYRYTGLRTAGGDSLTIYAVPTTIGAVVLACRMPKEEDGEASSRLCARMASTLRLTNGRAYLLGPSATFAKTLRRELVRLERRQSKALRLMGKAKQAESQATAAAGLADVYRDAARDLAAIRITPESDGGRAAIVAALRRVRDAYKRLAAAARREDTPDYIEAKQAVAAGERSMRQRLEELRPLGYKVT